MVWLRWPLGDSHTFLHLISPALAFLVVAAVTAPACYLIGYAATRVTGISKVL